MSWLAIVPVLIITAVWLSIFQPWRKRAALPAMDPDARHFRCAISQEARELGWNASWPLAAVTYDRRWFVVTFTTRQWSVDRSTGATIVYGRHLWNRKLVRGVGADGSRTLWVLRPGHREDTVADLASLGWPVEDRVHPVQVSGPPPVWWQ